MDKPKFCSWYARGDLNPYPRGMEPKSIVSANSTTGADCAAAVRTALTAVYFIISALCLSIVQIAAGGVGGAQGLLVLAVVDEHEGAGAAHLQQMDRRAAFFDRACQRRDGGG